MNVQVKLSNRKLTVMMNKSDFGGQCYIFFFHVTNVKFWRISLKEVGLSLTLLIKIDPN